MSLEIDGIEQLLTTEQVAELLQVPVDTVRWWRKRRRGPLSVPVGKHARYRPQDVRDWIAAQQQHL